MRADQAVVDHRAEIVVGEHTDLPHLVGGPEAVEEVEERHARFERGCVGHEGEVLGLLNGR